MCVATSLDITAAEERDVLSLPHPFGASTAALGGQSHLSEWPLPETEVVFRAGGGLPSSTASSSGLSDPETA